MDLVPRNTERTSSKLPPTLPSSMSSASNRKSFNKISTSNTNNQSESSSNLRDRCTRSPSVERTARIVPIYRSISNNTGCDHHHLDSDQLRSSAIPSSSSSLLNQYHFGGNKSSLNRLNLMNSSLSDPFERKSSSSSSSPLSTSSFSSRNRIRPIYERCHSSMSSGYGGSGGDSFGRSSGIADSFLSSKINPYLNDYSYGGGSSLSSTDQTSGNSFEQKYPSVRRTSSANRLCSDRKYSNNSQSKAINEDNNNHNTSNMNNIHSFSRSRSVLNDSFDRASKIVDRFRRDVENDEDGGDERRRNRLKQTKSINSTNDKPQQHQQQRKHSQSNDCGDVGSLQKEIIWKTLDKCEKRIHFFREVCFELIDEKTKLLNALHKISCICGSTTFDNEVDLQDIRATVEHLSNRLNSAEILVKPNRSLDQIEAYEKANEYLENLKKILATEGRSGAKKRCISLLSSCSSDDLDVSSDTGNGSLGPIDERFQKMVIDCSLEDQKTIRKKLTSFLEQIDKK
ncbi:BAG family molecular chaperone regulator 2 [Sarcoptes scabiei]|uniref:BAG family molecular chaperone regulator 2 n=1 Tax=Sarcoptes scabiei TaxID=52283 RepID=A0A834V8V4_SARSC|nr:BAG family molecular chaperone regulator 2 [Sarcoptes scabiei]